MMAWDESNESNPVRDWGHVPSSEVALSCALMPASSRALLQLDKGLPSRSLSHAQINSKAPGDLSMLSKKLKFKAGSSQRAHSYTCKSQAEK